MIEAGGDVGSRLMIETVSAKRRGQNPAYDVAVLFLLTNDETDEDLFTDGGVSTRASWWRFPPL